MIDPVSWFCGIFEGEGSMRCVKMKDRRDTYGISMCIKMTDEDIILRCLECIEVGRVKGPYHEHSKNKPMWYWEVSSQKDVTEVMGKIYFMLGTRRAEKARELLRYIDRKSPDLLPKDLKEELKVDD